VANRRRLRDYPEYIYEVNRDRGTKMKVLKHKIIVQNTEEPDSICIEDEYYEPTEDETNRGFESFFGIATKINLIN
jgi:hypothetical protein